nr:MAG TPA: hypothetical protein [Herelleviridae sp.]
MFWPLYPPFHDGSSIAYALVEVKHYFLLKNIIKISLKSA